MLSCTCKLTARKMELEIYVDNSQTVIMSYSVGSSGDFPELRVLKQNLLLYITRVIKVIQLLKCLWVKAIFPSLCFAKSLNILSVASIKLHSRSILYIQLPFTYTRLTFNSPGISLKTIKCRGWVYTVTGVITVKPNWAQRNSRI